MNYKRILIILGLLIVIEAAWLVWRIPNLKKAAPVEKKGTVIWLSPDKGKFSDQFTVDILLKTEEAIDGVDVRLFYPEDKLILVDQDEEKEGIQLEKGKFDDYPINKATDGLILLSGIVLKRDGIVFSDDSLIGRVVFKPITKGEVTLDFDFTLGSTTDCNIVDNQTHKDILEQALGAKYTLK